MRPLRLELQGFRSHAERTEIDFTARTLLAIVGPTGAGKSTILDGICYALYGRTSRVGKSTTTLICSRCEQAIVSFDFTVDGERFQVVRTINRARAGKHALQDATGDLIAHGDREVSQRIEELLGLGWEAFSSSILLAQGRFAQFLEAAPTKRVQILKGVFRFDQIDELREAAKSKVQGLELDLRGAEGALSQIPADADEQLLAAKAVVLETEKRREQLDSQRPLELELCERISSATRSIDAALIEVQLAKTRSENLPTEEEVNRLVEDESSLQKSYDEAEGLLKQAIEARGSAVEDNEAAVLRLGPLPDLIEARHLAVQLHKLVADRDADDRKIPDMEASLVRLRSQVKSEEAATLAAKEACRSFQTERRALEKAHAAHDLRSKWSPGEPCPVCEQAVSSMPAAGAPDLHGLDEREVELASVVEAQQRVLSGSSRQLAADEQRAQALRDAVAERSAQAAGLAVALDEKVGDFPDIRAEIDSRIKVLTGSAQLVEDARQVETSTQERLSRLDSQLKAVRERRQGSVQRFAHLSGQLGIDPSDLDSVEGLASLRRSLADRLAEEQRRAEAEHEAAKASVKAAEGDLAALRKELGLAEGMAVEAATQEVVAENARAETQITRLAVDIERRAELEKGSKAFKKRKDVFARIADDLTDRNFINYLLEDKRHLLSDLASVRLREMTGRYRFDDAGDFDVIDELDAEKERGVDSLSGGEMFLASLALALGLAEAATRHGGRLQCFFLDEGFGALDPESLDSALEGIENIVSPDRLIGLVSHVPAVAARIDDKLVLEKGPEGMTRIVSGAGL
ncbi:MAG: AAA family ATPase [Actinomycetota bacterium]